MTPWDSPAHYSFDEVSVLVNAPQRSGIYMLSTATACIFVGESANIRAQLLQHLRGDNSCIALYPLLTFSYELVPTRTRSWRHDELVREFRPACNKRAG